ncbi:acyltransferase family protein [Vibrio sp. WXL210]|uniref:acyltransferase family protein n=1 Tax=Vibrio sp. WXL210 TaxID=3450709 RepID=UPI003EC7BABF
MSALSKQDSEVLYITRALGIVLVVVGHYLWHPNWTWSPYLFHMPLFFILGGIVAKPVANPRYWLSKLVKDSLLYYLFWYCLLAILTWGIMSLWHTSIDFNLGHDIDVLYFPLVHNSHNNSLFMVGWFIIAYCLTKAAFQVFITLTRGLMSPAVVAAIGLAVGFWAIEVLAPIYSELRSWALNLFIQLCVGWMYFSIGYALRQYLHYLASMTALLVSWFGLAFLIRFGSVQELSMSWSQYPNGFLLHLCASVFGSLGVISAAALLRKLNTCQHLTMIGQLSKAIMTLHITFFVLVDLVFAEIGLIESQSITALNHYVTPQAFVVYLIAGLYGPIGVDRLWRWCQQRYVTQGAISRKEPSHARG